MYLAFGIGFLVIAWLSWRYMPGYMARTHRQAVHYLRLPVSPEMPDWAANLIKIGAVGVPGLAACFVIIAAIRILVE
jgi:hypothetical protein